MPESEPQSSQSGISEILVNPIRKHVYLRGYAFSGSGPLTLAIERPGKDPVRPLRTRLQRRDIAEKYPGADANCGFELVYPMDDAAAAIDRLVIAVRPVDGTETLLVADIKERGVAVAADVVVTHLSFNAVERVVTVRGMLEGDACDFSLAHLSVAGKNLALARLMLDPVVAGTRRRPARRGFTVSAPSATWVAKELFQLWPEVGQDVQVAFRAPRRDYAIGAGRRLEIGHVQNAVGSIQRISRSSTNGFVEIRGSFLGWHSGARVQLTLGGKVLARSARLEREQARVPAELADCYGADFTDWTWCDRVALRALVNKILRAELVEGSRSIGSVEVPVGNDVIVPVAMDLQPSYFVSPWAAAFGALAAAASTPSDDPAVYMIFPGDMFRTLAGGPARAIECARYLQSMGFQVTLIDLAEDADEHATVPPRHADTFHRRIGLPVAALDEFVHLALDNVLRDTRGEPAAALLRGALDRGEEPPGDLIAARKNLPFNAVAAFFVSLARPDFAIAHFAWCADIFEAVPATVCKLLDIHDVQYQRGELHLEFTGESNYVASHETEMNAMRKADYVLAIQGDDKELVIRETGRNNVILCGHALVPVAAPSVADDVHRLLFIGNRYPPNTLGLRRFIDRNWPFIVAAVPDAELWVVGSVAADFSGVPPGVKLLGRVPDLGEIYGAVTIVVNPVEFGTGLNIKTVEALSYGRCLVTTPSGLRGLDAAAAAVCRADAPTMHAEVIELLLAPDRRRGFEAAAAAFAEATMSPDRVFRELFNTMELRLSL